MVSVVTRRKRPAEKAVDVIRSNSRILVLTGDDSVEAGRLHAQIKSKKTNLSLADAFVLQAARRVGGSVLTGDPDFRGLRNAEPVE